VAQSKKLGEAMINTRLEMELAAQARFAPLNSFPYDADVFVQGRLSEEAEIALNEGSLAIRQQFDKGTLDPIALLEYFENRRYALIAYYKGDVQLAESEFNAANGPDGRLYKAVGGALEGMLPKILELVGRELTEFVELSKLGRQENLTEFITARAMMGGQKVGGDVAGLAGVLEGDQAMSTAFQSYLETLDLGTQEGQESLMAWLDAAPGLEDFNLKFETFVAP
jgi:hypothetical protein